MVAIRLFTSSEAQMKWLLVQQEVGQWLGVRMCIYACCFLYTLSVYFFWTNIHFKAQIYQ